ncbi:MAG TPA: phasin family protein [Stellaceae bacterium]|nr:phasin family protein [Stellaceae bacterium]
MPKVEESTNKRSSDTEERRLGMAGQLPDFDPFIRLSNKLIEGWMAVSTEMLEFGRSRLDQNIEMGKAMAQSTSLREAMDVQARYTRSIMQDYISEANKIADLSTRSLLDGISSLQSAPRRAEQRTHAAE